jgi:MarR-like DNA-binding transcriptional regulator SgrR of sgrS sRNA
MKCMPVQMEGLREKHQEAEKLAASLKAECARVKVELQEQEADLRAIRNTVAQQVDEMVRT